MELVFFVSWHGPRLCLISGFGLRLHSFVYGLPSVLSWFSDFVLLLLLLVFFFIFVFPALVNLVENSVFCFFFCVFSLFFLLLWYGVDSITLCCWLLTGLFIRTGPNNLRMALLNGCDISVNYCGLTPIIYAKKCISSKLGWWEIFSSGGCLSSNTVRHTSWWMLLLGFLWWLLSIISGVVQKRSRL